MATNVNFKVKNGLDLAGQITSTLATGTAPLVIASTTLVANLNSDMLDGYTADTGTTSSTIPVRNGSGLIPGDITGNAATVTNGVYTSGSYADPAWITSLSKSKVGLANVDNTSDANKPVSTATQTALNLKANIASPVFTGNVTGLGVATGTSFNSITGLASVAPLVDGSAAVGTSTLAARQDHVHATDTSRAAVAQTMYIGTTSVAINRASAALVLTGITSIDGNAATVTNGVYTSGSYADPAWITSLAKSKVGLANVENTALSTWAGSTNLTTAGALTASSLTVSGNLTVNGTTVTVNSTTVTLDDPIITLGGDTAPATDDSKDRGVEFRWHNGTAAKVGFFGFNDDNSRFMFIPDATNTSEVFSGTLGDIEATTFYGALSGNATTVTNGVYTSGSYADPAWITSLAKSKVGLGNVENTALSTWAGSSAITTVGAVTGTSFNSITALASVVSPMNGTAAVGTSTTVARQDHVHATDTSRAAVDQAMYIGTTSVAINRASAALVLTGITSIDGNAATVTNGVYTSGSYADPAWITSLAKSKVGLANVDNTSDANKPVSTATQTALNLKANIASPVFTGNVTGLGVATGTSFNSITGLASVAPLVDGSAAVGTSTLAARQDHIHPSNTLKADLASPTFTGIPAAPTAAPGTNTTQIATTAFVAAAVASSTLANGVVSSATITTASITQTAVSTYATATFRSVRFEIQVTSTTNYTMLTLFAIHDGTNVSITEFGNIVLGSALGTFDCDVNSGNLRLLFTAASTASTTVRVISTAINI